MDAKRQRRTPESIIDDFIAASCVSCERYPCLAKKRCQHRDQLWLHGLCPLGHPLYRSDLRDVTICVTWWLREAQLARCLASIADRYPHVTLLTQNTRGNLSWGRNRLVDCVETPYFLLCEEDMEFLDETDIARLKHVLDCDSEIGMVGGLCRGKGRIAWAHDFHIFRDRLEMSPAARPARVTPLGVAYQPCDVIWNFGIVRTSVARESPWDESLPLGEHREWFYRFHRQWRAAVCPGVAIQHHQERGSEEYAAGRERAMAYQSLAERKIGLRYAAPTGGCGERPDIVVLGVGHANTSLTTAQIFSIGWERNDADEEFSESVSVREINQSMLSGRDARSMEPCLARLRRPWALKDPRFARTLPAWMAAFEPYQPLLLWVTKDLDAVRSSALRRGETAHAADVEILHKRCAEHYAHWPWRKLQVAAEDLAAASLLCDASRLCAD